MSISNVMKWVGFMLVLIWSGQPVANAQTITAKELIRHLNLGSTEAVNQTLHQRGWKFVRGIEEEKPPADYQLIWGYDLEPYSERATAWAHLLTVQGKPAKMIFAVFNEKQYKAFQKTIAAEGFRFVKDDLYENEINAFYKNSTYFLTITTLRRPEEGYRQGVATEYRFALHRRGGPFDFENGQKVEYHDNGQTQGIYNVKDGVLHGKFETYYSDGSLELAGEIVHGERHGFFKEYSEDGSTYAEIEYRNGEKHGVMRLYQYEVLIQEHTFQHDEQTGPAINYDYIFPGMQPYFKEVGNYVSGEYDGRWDYYRGFQDKETLIEYTTYSRGVKHGPFQEMAGDSLIVGNYSRNKLHGPYRIYYLQGGNELRKMVEFKKEQLPEMLEGYYNMGLKTGHWVHYIPTLPGAKLEEGNYENDLKTGVWKNYMITIGQEEGEYEYTLKDEASYARGKLNGPFYQYMATFEEWYPCEDNEEEACSRNVLRDVRLTASYRDGVLHGPISYLDEANDTLFAGTYSYGKKVDAWITTEADYAKEIKGMHRWTFRGNFVNDEKHGKWIMYSGNINNIFEVLNYDRGDLHGEQIYYRTQGKINYIHEYKQGKFFKYVSYDSTGQSVTATYEIINEKATSYHCKVTVFGEGKERGEVVLWMKGTYDIDPIFLEAMISMLFNDKNNETRETGKLDGLSSGYDTQDRCTYAINYKMGERHGDAIEYFYDQGVIWNSYYDEGLLVRSHFTDLKSSPFTGTLTRDFESLDYRVVYAIKNGLLHGKTTYYSLSSGEKLSVEKYKNGVLK